MEQRDREILCTLTHKVRLLTLDQIARTWWGGAKSPRPIARRRLATLAAAGFVRCSRLNARPELDLREPLIAWSPSQAQPDFHHVAYRLQARWKHAPRAVTAYTATRKAATEFGGAGGAIKKPLQVSHDIHIATLYVRLLRTDPAAATAWLPEAKLAPFRRHQKLPDAALGDGPTALRLIIEFGNGYDAKRLAAFHADCAERGIPYEVW